MEKTNFSKPFLTPSQLIAKWGKVLDHDNWIKTPDKLDDKKE